MRYVGIQTQIRKNNFNSTLLLAAFPVLLMAMFYVFFQLIAEQPYENPDEMFMSTLPAILIGTAVWFLIAWSSHGALIRMATGSKPLERKENMRVYNLVENLCIAQGMPLPKIYVIEDDSLNAFASGIDRSSYAVSLSRGIINKLDDAELEGVIAHELSHIRNRDVRVLIISIIFVGIFAFLAEMALRSLRFGGSSSRRSRDGKGSGGIILIAIAVTAIAYLLSLLLRFGISRKREYMADAGAAEMTKNPLALASALRKISADPAIEAVTRRDVAQLFIDNPQAGTKKFSIAGLFATHPPIDERIRLLEQYT